jgi:hypothetical protein
MDPRYKMARKIEIWYVGGVSWKDDVDHWDGHE